MQFLHTNKRRKAGRQRERWVLSLQKEQLFLKSMKWNTHALKVYLHQKIWIQYKVCLRKHVHMYTNHTGGAKTVSCISSANQENGLETAEHQFILSPGLTCGWVKCYRFGWVCISFTAGLCPALKPVYKDLSNCLATFQGGRQKCCRAGFHPQRWALTVISLSWWNTIWPETKVVHLQQGGKSRKQYFSPPKYEIMTVILKSEKTTSDNAMNYEIHRKAPTKISYMLSRDWRINA